MSAEDPKTYLWANIEALMGGGKQSIDSVQARTSASRGTIQRIKEAKTSVGLDMLTQIASSFGIELWQLLKPRTSEKAPTQTAPALSLEAALKVLASHLDLLAEEHRDAVADRLATVAKAPDSEKALAALLQTISSLGEKSDDRKAAKPTGTHG